MDDEDVGEVIVDEDDDEDEANKHPKRMSEKEVAAINKFFELVHDEILKEMKEESKRIHKKMAKNGQGKKELKQMHREGKMKTPSKSKLSVAVRDAVNDIMSEEGGAWVSTTTVSVGTHILV